MFPSFQGRPALNPLPAIPTSPNSPTSVNSPTSANSPTSPSSLNSPTSPAPPTRQGRRSSTPLFVTTSVPDQTGYKLEIKRLQPLQTQDGEESREEEPGATANPDNKYNMKTSKETTFYKVCNKISSAVANLC